MSDEMQQDDTEQNGNEENAEQNAENQMLVDEEDDGEDDRKIFVGGLSWETSTKDLKEYFEKYGEVTNCTLKTDLETRKSRGFGFVVFGSSETVDKALAEKEHKLHGRTIDPKRANPRPVNKKVFVGRLDPTITEEEVKSYFETFGPVEKIELPFDKTKEQRRAFCFVEFKKAAGMKKCLEQNSHKVGTAEVEVKKATPPVNANTRGGGGPRGRGFAPPGRGARGGRGGGFQGGYNYNNQGYGGGYAGYGGYGYDQGYGYGGYGGDYYAGGYGGYGGWNGGGYDQGYGYGYGGGYDEWGGYGGQGGGQSNYGKVPKRGGGGAAGHGGGGYHPYSR